VNQASLLQLLFWALATVIVFWFQPFSLLILDSPDEETVLPFFLIFRVIAPSFSISARFTSILRSKLDPLLWYQ